MSPRRLVLAALVAVIALLAPPAMASPLATTHVLTRSARMSPGFAAALASAAPTTPFAAFVNVRDGLDAATVLQGRTDITILRNYPLISAAFVTGPISSIGRLASVAGVDYLEENRALSLHGDTNSWATRVRVAQEAVAGGPYTDSTGRVIDGTGVGVAVVDSGINAAHPDLENRVARNFKIVCTTPGLISTVTETCFGNWFLDENAGDASPRFGYVEVPPGTTTDTTSGHGTHVAGIVAGDGTASTGNYPSGTGPSVKGSYTGVAPGATLYGFSTGEVISVLFATEAHYYILSHPSEFTPRIKVVNNSWGDGGDATWDPASITAGINDALIASGVTMVYSAGNDGGTGAADATSSYCDNPTAGSICVANYDDEATKGGRDGRLDASSSRGLSTNSTLWPDISAPGAFITSPCVREVQPICNFGYVDEARWGPWYSSISGTSMAAPHVAGIVALLLQANPTLTPANLENLLQDTAYKFTSGAPYASDPQNPDGSSSYDKGAGLADLKAALNALGTTSAGAVAASNLELIGGDGGDFAFGAGDIISLSVTQTTGSSSAGGFRFDVRLANAADFAPTNAAQYRLFLRTNGLAYTINVNATPTGVIAGAATPLTSTAEDVTRAGNVVSFFVPYTKLGGVSVGEPIFGVQIAAYIGTAVDAAPSNDPALVMLVNRPMFGKAFARV